MGAANVEVTTFKALCKNQKSRFMELFMDAHHDSARRNGGTHSAIWIGSIIYEQKPCEQREMAAEFEQSGSTLVGACAIGGKVVRMDGTIRKNRIVLEAPCKGILKIHETSSGCFMVGHLLEFYRRSDGATPYVYLRRSQGTPVDDRVACWRYFVRRRNNQKLLIGCTGIILCPLYLIWMMTRDNPGEKAPMSALIALFAFIYSLLYLLPVALYERITARPITYTAFDKSTLGKIIECANSGNWPED